MNCRLTADRQRGGLGRAEKSDCRLGCTHVRSLRARHNEIRLFKLQILTPKIMIFEINGPNELFTIGVFSARPRFGKYCSRLWVKKTSTLSRGVKF